jgi:ceramide glucosyltransferase
MLVYYFLAAISIWLGLLSLRGGLRFRAYVLSELATPLPDYSPFVTVIAPFRGLDAELKENLGALLQQDYPAYEVVFVTDSPRDPGLPIVEEVRSTASDKLQFVDELSKTSLPKLSQNLEKSRTSFPNDNLKIVGRGAVTSRIVIAGPATDSGQKVHNLRAAVAKLDPRTQVIVFVDSDARPHEQWLRFLVAPLADPSLGAASGYRWFSSAGVALANHLRSVWNASIASALGSTGDKNFCWGGSTAIRRSIFEDLQIAKKWRGSVSDDFTLTRALQQAKLRIKFVPRCLLLSSGNCGWGELIEFTTRQLIITRVYASHLWKALLLGSSLFVLVFFGGLALVLLRGLMGQEFYLLSILLGMIFVLGSAKAWLRVSAVNLALQNYKTKPRQSLLAHLLLWPFGSALFLYNALGAAWSRRIRWRGITYELKSPDEAVIIAREAD